MLKSVEELGIRPNSPNHVAFLNARADLVKETNNNRQRYPAAADYHQPSSSSSFAAANAYAMSDKSKSTSGLQLSPSHHHHHNLPVANRLTQSSSLNSIQPTTNKYPTTVGIPNQSSLARQQPTNGYAPSVNNSNHHSHHHSHSQHHQPNKQFAQTSAAPKPMNPHLNAHHHQLNHHHHQQHQQQHQQHHSNVNYAANNGNHQLYNNTNNNTNNYNRPVPAQNPMPTNNFSSHRTQNATGSKF